MNKITVVGSSNTDMVVKTDRFPAAGETILGGEFFLFAGGKGANQAVAAARLGGQVRFVGRVGDDLFGRQAVMGLEREGLDCSAVSIDPVSASGTALITVNKEGENSIVVAPGANSGLLPDLVHKLGILRDDYVLTQLETPLETVEALSVLTDRLVLNPAPASRLPETLLSRLFMITPNETETKLLTGVTVTDAVSAGVAAKKLLESGVKHVVITMGKAGAFYRGAEGSFLVPAPRVTALDTTAAGDVFNGALVVSLAEGSAMREAIGFAVSAASVSVTRMGAQASAPYRKEL